jgi:hypothetical protein
MELHGVTFQPRAITIVTAVRTNKSQLFSTVELFLPLQTVVSDYFETTWKAVIMKYISITCLEGLQESHEDH